MPPASESLACPHCRTPLRFRQPPRGVTTFPCPECDRLLELEERDDEYVVRPAAPSKASHPPSRMAETASPGRKAGSTLSSDRIATPRPERSAVWSTRWSRWRSRVAQRLAEPLTVTWLVAGLAALVLIVALIRERGPAETPRLASSSGQEQPGQEQPGPDSEVDPPGRAVDEPEMPHNGDGNGEAIDADNGNAVDDESPEPGELAEDVPAVDALPEKPIAARRPPVVADRPTIIQPPDLSEEIERRLSQPLVTFEQATPVAFDEMRSQLQELVAVPIWYDESLGEKPAAAEQHVWTSLDGVTVGEVLESLARQAKLTYRIEAEGIRLIGRPGETGDAAPLPGDANDSP